MAGRGKGHTKRYAAMKLHEFRKILAQDNGPPLTDKQIAQKLTERGFPTLLNRVWRMRKNLDIPNSYRRGRDGRAQTRVHEGEV